MEKKRKDENPKEPLQLPNPEIWEEDALSHCAAIEEVMRIFKEIQNKYKEASNKLNDK